MSVHVGGRGPGHSVRSSAHGIDYYVDSVNGLDSNAGTSSAAPFQTLAKLQTVLTSGKKVGLARGSLWREWLNQPSLNNVTIVAYGNGAAPIIDGADIISGWVADTNPNVWKITGYVLPADSGGVHANVVENDVLLNGVASAVACIAGSRFVTAYTGTIDIYVCASDASNPNTNGKQYKIAAREHAISLGSGAVVSGIETKNNRGNDGSIVVGNYSTIAGNTIRNGGKHNLLVGFGSTVSGNQILESHNNFENGIQVVAYSSSAPAGSTDTLISGNTFTQRGLLASPSNISATYCHTSSGTVAGNLYVTGNTFTDCFGTLAAGAANISGLCYFQNNYVTCSQFTSMPYKFGGGGAYCTADNYTGNKFYFPEPWATTFSAVSRMLSADGTTVCDNNEFFTGPYFTRIVGGFSGTPNITARNNKGVTTASLFIATQTATATLGTISGNIMGVQTPLQCQNTVTVSGIINNNGWPGADTFQIGTSRTWAQHVAAGYDVNSTANGDNRTALRAKGAAAVGDLSDWSPYLWINAQNAASISQSGGFASAVSDLGHGARNLALLAPVPASDKVQVTSPDGRSWFKGVGNGGLRYAAQDTVNQCYIFAAVVRPTVALCAANALGMLISTKLNDQGGALFGDMTVLTNEIVSFKQGGSNYYYYADLVATWAANVPHLIVGYFDPVSTTGVLRIDGIQVGAMSLSSLIVHSMFDATKGDPLTVLRGNNTANPFAGMLGELFISGGPTSLDAVTEIEADMRARWGI